MQKQSQNNIISDELVALANQKLIGWEWISPLSADNNMSMLAVKVSSVNGVTALVFLHSTYVSNSLR